MQREDYIRIFMHNLVLAEHQYLQMSVEYEHVLRKKLLLEQSKTAYGYAKGCF